MATSRPAFPDPAPPARRTGRPTRAGTQQLNEHLLDVAERHFLAHGFEAASMDRLALEARASKRTIYQRYAGKHALFEAVVERALVRLLGDAAETAVGDTVAARLNHLALGMIDRVLCPEIIALMRVVIAEAHRFPDIAQSLERRGWLRLVTAIGEVLATEVSDGALNLTPSVEVAAGQFLSLTITPLAMRILMGGQIAEVRAEAADAVAQAIPLFLHGCCPPPTAAGEEPAKTRRRGRARATVPPTRRRSPPI